MKIIIPMAGRGTRLRPHTLVTPKPLLPIAGKPIVERLAEDIVELYDGNVEEIAFIIGDFGSAVETQLMEVAHRLGAKGSIYHQEQALGTAHAIWQAADSMDGEIIIAFADTLFRADFKLDREHDGVIWVKRVDDPRAFGVVTVGEDHVIREFVEKPQEYVSDLAIIGIYYIRDGVALREEIRHLIDNDIREKGEYQLTNALENLKAKGARFTAGPVNEWMDCGNKKAVLETTEKILEFDAMDGKPLRGAEVELDNVIVREPCYIGDGAVIRNSEIGPYVAVGSNTLIDQSVISMSTIGANGKVLHCKLHDSMVGPHSEISDQNGVLDVGDFSRIKAE